MRAFDVLAMPKAFKNEHSVHVRVLEYVGTPFSHQGRRPGKAIDCVGVFVCAARAEGYDIDDCTVYGRNPNPRQLLDYVSRNSVQIPLEEAVEGDSLLFWYARRMRRTGEELPRHLGVLSWKDGRPAMVHAWEDVGRVEHSTLDDPYWEGKILSAWRLKPERRLG
ncbi:MAG: hypothetical protein GY716_15765 [bacterium]|nr:hypothetical protein [bacterium]